MPTEQRAAQDLGHTPEHGDGQGGGLNGEIGGRPILQDVPRSIVVVSKILQDVLAFYQFSVLYKNKIWTTKAPTVTSNGGA